MRSKRDPGRVEAMRLCPACREKSAALNAEEIRRELPRAFIDLENFYETVAGRRVAGAYEEVWSGRRQSGERQLRAPSLSIALTDRLTDNVRQESAGTLFGDEAWSYRHSSEQVVEVRKGWRKEGKSKRFFVG